MSSGKTALVCRTVSKPPVEALETIFDQGAEELEQIVSALNQRRLFDRSGQPWNEATFREFLHVNGF